MMQFQFMVLNTVFNISLDNEGRGWIEGTDYNDKLPIVDWRIVNPGEILKSDERIERAYAEALKRFRRDREITWATSPETIAQIRSLEERDEGIERMVEELNKAIKSRNILFSEIHDSAQKGGVKTLEGFHCEGGEYTSCDHPMVEVYDPDKKVDIDIRLMNYK